MTTDNPAIKKERTSFKSFDGTEIEMHIENNLPPPRKRQLKR
jgi:hypothetical protein